MMLNRRAFAAKIMSISGPDRSSCDLMLKALNHGKLAALRPLRQVA
jgi:hypothetical protein